LNTVGLDETADARRILTGVHQSDWSRPVGHPYQGWQVFAGRWKKPFFSAVKTGLAKIVFAGKNRFFSGKNLRQKPIFGRIVVKVNFCSTVFFLCTYSEPVVYVFCTVICGNPLLTHRYSLVVY